MSEIELAPLSETLEDDELKALQKLLEQAGARFTGSEDQTRHKIATRLDEDAMTEFLDQSKTQGQTAALAAFRQWVRAAMQVPSLSD